MTTLIRVEPPVASRNSKIIPATSFSDGSVASLSQTKLTFSPVTSEVISEIIGYATLGLSDVANSETRIPSQLYKWHTWLIRMNNWMTANKSLYPHVMEVPKVSIPADLYFMSDITTKSSVSDVVANAATAPLGPLLPADHNTLLNALSKGLQKCTQDGMAAMGNTTDLRSKKRNFVAFVRDVNKIAFYAIQPENDGANSAMTIPISSITDESLSIMPLPPSVKNTFSTAIEHFNLNNDKRGLFSKIPMWAWVAILMAVVYFFIKENKTVSYEPSAPSWNAVGGARVFDISDFHPPSHQF